MARQRELNAYINFVTKQAAHINSLLNKRFAIYKEAQKELETKCDEIVTAFYSGYDPRWYHRYGGLYTAYQVTISDNRWLLEMGPEFMSGGHHQSEEIVYHNVFELGYHGGSFDSEGLLDQPYWRLPMGEFLFWGDPAISSPAPRMEMEKCAIIFFGELRDKMIKQVIDPIKDDLIEWKRRLQKIKG